MAQISRRHFIGTAAAATAAATLLPASLRHAAASATVAGGSLADVRHIVILSQENRSFDHYFGHSRGVRGFNDRNALTFNGRTTLRQASTATSTGYVSPFRMGWVNQTPFCQAGGSMNWSVNHEFWNRGRVDQWHRSEAGAKMGYLARHELSFYYELADAFTIADNYHCSAFTQTNPNRLFMFTGTNGVSIQGAYPGYTPPIVIDNSVNAANRTLKWTTFPERLQNAGISWKFYQNGPLGDGNFDDNPLVWFTQYQNTGSPLHQRGMTTVADIPAVVRADVVAGTLPQVSFIVTRYEESEHPNAKPPAGELFTSKILDALYAPFDGHPHGVWEDTIFIVTYDENGGYYDHVPPPVPPSPASGGGSKSNVGVDAGGTVIGEIHQNVPTGPGWRVPLIAVSPWSRGGYVNSQTFDHTSLLRLLEKWSAAVGKPVTETNISPWRRAVCGDLTSVFDFSSAAAFAPMPGAGLLPAAISTACGSYAIPPDQIAPVQESGTKPARALPWQPDAAGRIAGAEKRFYIDMVNTGTAAVTFTVLPNAFRTDGPWHYTVGAGTATTAPLSDFFAASDRFDLSLYGPNGFHRRFAGTISKAAVSGSVEVRSTYAANGTAITLTFANTTGSARTVTVTDNAYGTGGPWSQSVPAGGSSQATFTTDRGWYDLTVTADTSDGFLRRLAGHVENGSASVTDPAAALGVIPREGWTVEYADSQETSGEDGAAKNVLDGSGTSIWHTQWQAAGPAHPHEIRLDMAATRSCAGFSYLPRQSGVNGTIAAYEFYVSADGVNWGSPVASGTWAADAALKTVIFPVSVNGRRVRLRALSEINGGPWTSAAEINVLSRA
ncbi:phosphocholine-specific phospholipase C [Streptosporangium sp. CA-135522]|uniref:phosphocholine-specific phospholipase C n=1 Tax=Streptosporangium sp. CA-135522 TaxID=3240072 RepID=UPI003D920D44